MTDQSAAAERVAGLVSAIVDALRERGLCARGGPAVQWGQKVVVEAPDGAGLGNLVAYWGKKGPRVVFTELRPGLGEAVRKTIDEAVTTAERAVSGPGILAPDLASQAGSSVQRRDSLLQARAVPPSRPGTVEIWTDGSYVRQGERVAVGWAFIVRKDGVELHRASGTDIPPGTEKHLNVAGEMVAVMKALEWCRANGIDSITIYHDYQSLPFWPAGSWKAREDLTKHYKRQVVTSGIRIEWHWVRAHVGAVHNEDVDKLARDAAMRALERP